MLGALSLAGIASGGASGLPPGEQAALTSVPAFEPTPLYFHSWTHTDVLLFAITVSSSNWVARTRAMTSEVHVADAESPVAPNRAPSRTAFDSPMPFE